MSYRDKINNYVIELTGEKVLDHSINLFEHGLLTSLDVLDLITFIEKTFNLKIPEDDISMESFGSINGIVTLVEKLQSM